MGKNNRENLDYFMEKMNCCFAIYPYSLISRQRVEKLDSDGEEIISVKKKLVSGGFMINRRLEREGHTPFMFLTNNLIKSFHEPINTKPNVMNREYADIVKQSLLDFYELVTNKRSVLDKPIKKRPTMEENMIGYMNEVFAVCAILDQFIGSKAKQEVGELEVINDMFNYGTIVYEAFNERLVQAKQFFFLTDNGLIIWYCSQGILPLVWCEIKFCIENHIRIKECPYCGIFYVCPSNNPNKHHCGSQACLYQYNINTRGPEAIRKANRIPGRLPGRPKKSK